jgi:hypothetical protein
MSIRDRISRIATADKQPRDDKDYNPHSAIVHSSLGNEVKSVRPSMDFSLSGIIRLAGGPRQDTKDLTFWDVLARRREEKMNKR